jgi:hypothetical protein
MNPKTILWGGALASFLGCARAPTVSSTIAQPPRGNAVQTVAQISEAPDPPEMHRMRHAAWSLGVPQDWTEREEANVISFRPPGEVRTGSPMIGINESPNDGSSLEDIRQGVESAYTARNMRMESHRTGTQDGHSWLEVRLIPSRTSGDMRMLGYVLVTGSRFAWAICGAIVSRWSDARAGCEATLATVHIGARAPAAVAGRRRIGEGDTSMAVPAAWTERRTEHEGRWQVMASEHGLDTDEVQVFITGADLGVPRAEVLNRLTEGLQRDGYTPSTRARRTIPAGTVDTIILDKHEDIPDVVVHQRFVLTDSTVYILTCAGPTAQYGGANSPCMAMFDGFRLTH